MATVEQFFHQSPRYVMSCTVEFVAVEEGDTADAVIELARASRLVGCEWGFETFEVHFPWEAPGEYSTVTESTLRRLLSS